RAVPRFPRAALRRREDPVLEPVARAPGAGPGRRLARRRAGPLPCPPPRRGVGRPGGRRPRPALPVPPRPGPGLAAALATPAVARRGPGGDAGPIRRVEGA